MFGGVGPPRPEPLPPPGGEPPQGLSPFPKSSLFAFGYSTTLFISFRVFRFSLEFLCQSGLVFLKCFG